MDNHAAELHAAAIEFCVANYLCDRAEKSVNACGAFIEQHDDLPGGESPEARVERVHKAVERSLNASKRFRRLYREQLIEEANKES